MFEIVPSLISLSLSLSLSFHWISLWVISGKASLNCNFESSLLRWPLTSHKGWNRASIYIHFSKHFAVLHWVKKNCQLFSSSNLLFLDVSFSKLIIFKKLKNKQKKPTLIFFFWWTSLALRKFCVRLPVAPPPCRFSPFFVGPLNDSIPPQRNWADSTGGGQNLVLSQVFLHLLDETIKTQKERNKTTIWQSISIDLIVIIIITIIIIIVHLVKVVIERCVPFTRFFSLYTWKLYFEVLACFFCFGVDVVAAILGRCVATLPFFSGCCSATFNS